MILILISYINFNIHVIKGLNIIWLCLTEKASFKYGTFFFNKICTYLSLMGFDVVRKLRVSMTLCTEECIGEIKMIIYMNINTYIYITF